MSSKHSTCFCGLLVLFFYLASSLRYYWLLTLLLYLALVHHSSLSPFTVFYITLRYGNLFLFFLQNFEQITKCSMSIYTRIPFHENMKSWCPFGFLMYIYAPVRIKLYSIFFKNCFICWSDTKIIHIYWAVLLVIIKLSNFLNTDAGC